MAVPTTRKAFKEYCLNNKYTKWYFDIIDNAIVRNWDKESSELYLEKHHYIPKVFGGDEKQTVFLTAREHFICHILLTKMLTGEMKAKMVWAVMCMKGKENRYVNSYLYENAKKHIKHSDESKLKMSETRIKNKTSSKEKNPMWGKRGELSPIFGTKQSLEHKEKRLSKVRGRKQTSETRMKMSQNRPKGPSGKKWFNNGIKETFDLPEKKPDGFVFGRLSRS